jgi:hypothetical protein
MSHRKLIHTRSPDRNIEHRIPRGNKMKLNQAFIAPAAGIAVVLSSIAVFGAAFGILVGVGLATVTIVTGSMVLSADAGIEAANGSTATSPSLSMRV